MSNQSMIISSLSSEFEDVFYFISVFLLSN